MHQRFILIFGPELLPCDAPVDYFWLYSIDERKVIYPSFATEALARDYAKAKNGVVVDQWLPEDLVLIEEVVGRENLGGAFIVFITAYFGDRAAPAAHQPKHRYLVFTEYGVLVGTRATPVEAFRLLGALAPIATPDEVEVSTKPTERNTTELQP